MRRVLLALSFALALGGCTAAASPTAISDDPDRGCPKLTPIEAIRKAIEDRAGGAPSETPQLDVSDFGPFCERSPQAVLCAGNVTNRRLTAQDVMRIDLQLRADFEYRGDYTTYGSWDRWRNNVTCGDCEDYALTLAERLAAAGQDGRAMSLMIWMPSPEGAHATLLVETADRGLLEVGVGPSEVALPYRAEIGWRFAIMPMDGARTLILHPQVSWDPETATLTLNQAADPVKSGQAPDTPERPNTAD